MNFTTPYRYRHYLHSNHTLTWEYQTRSYQENSPPIKSGRKICKKSGPAKIREGANQVSHLQRPSPRKPIHEGPIRKMLVPYKAPKRNLPYHHTVLEDCKKETYQSSPACCLLLSPSRTNKSPKVYRIQERIEEEKKQNSPTSGHISYQISPTKLSIWGKAPNHTEPENPYHNWFYSTHNKPLPSFGVPSSCKPQTCQPLNHRAFSTVHRGSECLSNE